MKNKMLNITKNTLFVYKNNSNKNKLRTTEPTTMTITITVTGILETMNSKQ